MRVARVATSSWSVIADSDVELAVLASALDPYRTAFRPDGNSMANSILCQCLHRKRRHIEVEGFRINFQINFQPVFIAKLFKRDVLAREIVLLGKLDQLTAIFFQGVAQHVTK